MARVRPEAQALPDHPDAQEPKLSCRESTSRIRALHPWSLLGASIFCLRQPATPVYTLGVELPFPGSPSDRDGAFIHSPNSCAPRMTGMLVPAGGGEERARMVAHSGIPAACHAGRSIRGFNSCTSSFRPSGCSYLLCDRAFRTP